MMNYRNIFSYLLISGCLFSSSVNIYNAETVAHNLYTKQQGAYSSNELIITSVEILNDDLNELAENLRTKHKEELDERIKFFEPLSSFKYKWLVKMESEPTYHLTVGNNAEQAMNIANGEFRLKVVMETWDADKNEYVLVDKPSIHSVQIFFIKLR